VTRGGGTARSWSRQRNDLTDGFRDIAAAAVSQLPDGVVLDGELLVSTNGRLDFDALQKRLVTTSPARPRQLIAAIPASYVAFDLLASAGVDLRTQRWATRRSRLEQLAAGWSPPLQLTPVTYDADEGHRRTGRQRPMSFNMPGHLSFHGAAASNAAAARITAGSSRWRPMICKPTGRPSSVHPAGTLAAGCPVKLRG
jgi:hypothetical protein